TAAVERCVARTEAFLERADRDRIEGRQRDGHLPRLAAEAEIDLAHELVERRQLVLERPETRRELVRIDRQRAEERPDGFAARRSGPRTEGGEDRRERGHDHAPDSERA